MTTLFIASSDGETDILDLERFRICQDFLSLWIMFDISCGWCCFFKKIFVIWKKFLLMDLHFPLLHNTISPTVSFILYLYIVDFTYCLWNILHSSWSVFCVYIYYLIYILQLIIGFLGSSQFQCCRFHSHLEIAPFRKFNHIY